MHWTEWILVRLLWTEDIIADIISSLCKCRCSVSCVVCCWIVSKISRMECCEMISFKIFDNVRLYLCTCITPIVFLTVVKSVEFGIWGLLVENSSYRVFQLKWVLLQLVCDFFLLMRTVQNEKWSDTDQSAYFFIWKCKKGKAFFYDVVRDTFLFKKNIFLTGCISKWNNSHFGGRTCTSN